MAGGIALKNNNSAGHRSYWTGTGSKTICLPSRFCLDFLMSRASENQKLCAGFASHFGQGGYALLVGVPDRDEGTESELGIGAAW